MALGLRLLPVFLGLAGALPGALPTQEVWQCSSYTIIPKGGSVNITCSSPRSRGVYLKRNCGPKPTNDMIYYDENNSIVDELFGGRIAFSGSQCNLTITIQLLQPADSCTYVCTFITDTEEIWGPSTLVVVTDTLLQAGNAHQEARRTHVALPAVLAAGLFLLGLGLGAVCVLRRMQIKKLCCAKDKPSVCVVYEDMSCSRCNTISTANHYQ